ncbi:hypothetical protein IV203_025273 [Nitzschia inconspicua]|uniref:Uncharacterized protein n=1 Tax=Nitzschia inconspicua TaxID=303405 RepID=A0A9K3LHD3_9STRA|nr:hypothetical protein IV203_024722 [Nitzschia inconspicua]KAG7362389.1 hypothetical protein IV203_025273 [Nitzschia inconspicua]
MAVDDGFTNIRRGQTTTTQLAGLTKQLARPLSQASSTSATESSDSSSASESGPASHAATTTTRLPAWKLREAAKSSAVPKRSISNSSTGRPSKMTMEVGNSTSKRRSNSTTSKPATDTSAAASMQFPNSQTEEKEISEDVSTTQTELAARRAARAASWDTSRQRTSSRDPSSRVSSRTSSREPSRRTRTTSTREPHRNRSEPATCSSSRESTKMRSSSRDPVRVRSASRESRRSHASVMDEVPGTHGTGRTVPLRGYRRAMKKNDLEQHDEAIPSMFRSYVPSTLSTSGGSNHKPTASLKDKHDTVSIKGISAADRAQKPDIQREPSTQSVGGCAFPSTFSFDNDDPFTTSSDLTRIEPQNTIPKLEPESAAANKDKSELAPVKRKTSKTSKTVSKMEKEDELSCIPSMFLASIDHGKQSKKSTSKKSSSKSKKDDRNGKDVIKSPSPTKKKNKTKTSDPESLGTTKKSKKSTKKSKAPSKEEAKEHESKKRLPDGFDWDVPVTPVFETPVSRAPKKKLSSKEDILKRKKDNSEAFHNSLDDLFELPADLFSPTTGKIKMDDNDMPIISFSDDASHASDMSSIRSISEYSEMDGGIEVPSSRITRSVQRTAVYSCDRSVRSHRSGATRLSQSTKGTRNSHGSCGTTATAWQLREQQKHARRPGGRRCYSMQTAKTTPTRPRRAMTTQLEHQKIPLPPAFSTLSAPSTPKTPAMNRRLMSNKERLQLDNESSHRRGNITDSLFYFSGDADEMSIEPDLLSQCSRSIYSVRSQNLKRFNSKPVEKRLTIPKNAKLEIDPTTGKQQLVMDLGDIPAAFLASLQATQKKR